MRTVNGFVIACAVLGAGVVSAADQPAAEERRPEQRAAADDGGMERPDAWITTKVKLALLTDDQVSGMEVNVDTTDGRVTLHGSVDSAAEKTRAEQVARGIEGVRSVRNQLTIETARAQERGAVSDDTLEEQVTSAIKSDPVLKDSNITVSSVNDGVVTLGGSAASAGDELRAVQTARDVTGVKRVNEEIAAADRLGDDELWDSDREHARGRGADATDDGEGRGAGTVVTDMWITSAAKMRLAANEQTPAMDINVDTYKGKVTLFGTVPTEAAKRAAETEVRAVDGVKQIDNQLAIGTQGQKAADAPEGDQ